MAMRRFERGGVPDGRLVSSGAPNMRALADEVERFGRDVAQVGRRVSNAKADQAGAAAGAAGKFRKRTVLTEADTRYNAAAQAAYLARVGSQIDHDAEELSAAHPEDHEAFREKFRARGGALLENLDPDVGALVQQRLDVAERASVLAITERARKKQFDADVATLQSTRTDILERAARQIRDGGHPEVLAAQFSAAREDYSGLLQVNAGLGLVEPHEVPVLLEEFDRRMAREAILGEFEEESDKPAMLKAFQASPEGYLRTALGEDLDLMLRNDEIEGITTHMRQRIREEKADAAAALALDREQRALLRSAAEQRATDVGSRLNAGYAVPRDELTATLRDLELQGHTDLAQGVRDAFKGHEDRRQLALMAPGERAADLGGRVPDTAAGVKRQQELERMHEAWTKAQHEDPLAYFAQFSGSPLPPANPYDAEAMAARSELASQLARRWRVPVAPLTRAEVQALAVDFGSADVVGKVQRLGQLAASIPDPRQREALAGHFAKESTPLAVAMGLAAEGDASGAALVLRGTDAKAVSAGVGWEERTLLDMFRLHVGDAFAGSPKSEAMAVEGARLMYQALAQESGLVEPSRDLLIASIDRVTGGVVEWNGHQVIAPVPRMSQREFSEWLYNIDADYLEALGGTDIDEDVALRWLRSNGVLRPLGNGEYSVEIIGFDDDLTTLMASDGGVFRLRYDPSLIGRRPPRRARPTSTLAAGEGVNQLMQDTGLAGSR